MVRPLTHFFAAVSLTPSISRKHIYWLLLLLYIHDDAADISRQVMIAEL